MNQWLHQNKAIDPRSAKARSTSTTVLLRYYYGITTVLLLYGSTSNTHGTPFWMAGQYLFINGNSRYGWPHTTTPPATEKPAPTAVTASIYGLNQYRLTPLIPASTYQYQHQPINFALYTTIMYPASHVARVLLHKVARSSSPPPFLCATVVVTANSSAEFSFLAIIVLFLPYF